VKKKGEMKNLLSLLSEDNGNTSSTRIIMFAWMLGILLIWSVNSIKTGVISDLPDNVLICMGIIMGAKVAQKPLEGKKCDTNPEVK